MSGYSDLMIKAEYVIERPIQVADPLADIDAVAENGGLMTDAKKDKKANRGMNTKRKFQF